MPSSSEAGRGRNGFSTPVVCQSSQAAHLALRWRAPKETCRTLRILHLIDTLGRGGAELTALHLSNALVHRGHAVVLCATRKSGPLASRSEAEVLTMGKRSRWDLAAHRRLEELIASREFDVVHAHSSSIFSAWRVLRHRRPTPVLVWHDHFGDLGGRRRATWPLRLMGGRIDTVVAASEELVRWNRFHLGNSAIWLPNAVPAPAETAPALLEGEPGKRLVCVANFRQQKDHLTLLRAIAPLCHDDPRLRLFLVGVGNERSTRPLVEAAIRELDLDSQVHLLGERGDVPEILAACDIGVLSSRSEGLPLTLLEYGWAGLAVACSDVGQCSAVLGDGRGLLVRPGDPGHLRAALEQLLNDPRDRNRRATALQQYLRSNFDLRQVAKQLEMTYLDAFRRVSGGDPPP
jgi:glycosyltransferase involved in cell wall biosynthesis